jgi:hypothetical protein
LCQGRGGRRGTGRWAQSRWVQSSTSRWLPHAAAWQRRCPARCCCLLQPLLHLCMVLPPPALEPHRLGLPCGEERRKPERGGGGCTSRAEPQQLCPACTTRGSSAFLPAGYSNPAAEVSLLLLTNLSGSTCQAAAAAALTRCIRSVHRVGIVLRGGLSSKPQPRLRARRGQATRPLRGRQREGGSAWFARDPLGQPWRV